MEKEQVIQKFTEAIAIYKAEELEEMFRKAGLVGKPKHGGTKDE